MARNPLNGDLAMRTGVDAISDCVRNLVRTRLGDLPYGDQAMGTQLSDLLFGQLGPATLSVIETQIAEVIEKYEPRASNVVVQVRKSATWTVSVDVQFDVVGLGATKRLSVEWNAGQ